jgi:hypothetical protein
MPAKRLDTPLAASPEAKFSYTKKFTDSKKKMEKAPAMSGVKVSASGTSSAKPYEKKFIPADKKRTNAVIVDSKGKTVKAADSKKGSKSANEKLYKEFKRDSTDTMKRRERNANFRDVNTGAKKNLTASDLKSLKDLGKIKKA